jgi:hypothetical protein
MPYSYDFFNKEVKDFVNKLDDVYNILDVGPGAGKYGKLLKKENRTIDAVEVFAPYISQYNLHNIYNTVHNANILDFDFSQKQYDLVIMGDILEHLSVEEAVSLLNEIDNCNIAIIVLVPYNYFQGKSHGNDHEEHKQPDLTEKVFQERYSGFKKIFGNDEQGVFYRAKK